MYNIVLGFHKGPRRLLVDLGTGHGLICRSLADEFEKVVGTDPSQGMIDQARSSTSKDEYPNVEFVQAPAESLPFLDDQTVDMVVAGQAAHWFEHPKLFSEMKRIIRPGGTLALWGYTDHVFPDYPTASQLLHETAYGMSKDLLGSYWQQPGRSIIQNYLRDIKPPQAEWDVERREHDPMALGSDSDGVGFVMQKRMTVAMNMEYIRTWSSYHGWKDAHPDRLAISTGGEGDVVDDLFENIRRVEPDWENHQDLQDMEVEIEWGTALILARRRD